MLNGYVLVGYVLNGYVWDMCGVIPFEWIRIEWIRTGGIRVERIRIGRIRFERICVGYVWCDGYVWDMSGVRYANNLLKNPATKRLSGKTNAVRYLDSKVSTTESATFFHPASGNCANNSWAPRGLGLLQFTKGIPGDAVFFQYTS